MPVRPTGVTRERLGIVLPNACPREAMLETARHAEVRGLEAVYVVEGLGRDAASQLGFLAAVTSRATLGTAIVPVLTRSAGLLAMTAASLDELCGGRLVLGLGTGAIPLLRPHGVTVSDPLGTMRDYVTAVRAALTGAAVTHMGERATLHGFRLWLQPVRRSVPIYLSALGPRMAALAGEIADGVLLNMVSPRDVAFLRGQLAEGAARADRPVAEVDIGGLVVCSLAKDAQGARRDIARRVAYYGAQRSYRQMWRRNGLEREAAAMVAAFEEGGRDAAARHVSEEMVGLLSVAAGPDDLRATVGRLREAGVALPLIYPSIHDPEHATAELLDAIEAAVG